MKAIVTGHSRGLGAALAAQLLDRGMAVLGLSRSSSDDLAQRFAHLQQHRLDLSDPAALRAWLDSTAIERFVGGDEPLLLINNAALAGPLGQGGSLGDAAVAAAITLNVVAPLMLSERVLGLARNGKGRGQGERRILHISSGASQEPVAGWSSYCASKAALDQHARSVACERQSHVRIASVMPGVIDTGMQAQLRSQEGFASRHRFTRLHEDGLLQAADPIAHHLVELLLSEEFGAEPVLALTPGMPGGAMAVRC